VPDSLPQPDSLKKLNLFSKADSLLPSDSTLRVALADSSKAKNWLQFKSPIFEEDGKLKVNIDLPGRRPLKFTVPKMFFAPPPPPFDPEVAWRRSILIPGWGQYYNRRAWKIPFFYAGYGVAGFLILDAHTNYKDYQRAYRIRIQRDDQGLSISRADSLFMLGESFYESSAPSNLQTQRDNFRQQRDRYILLAIGYHLIQTLEAYITAHLRDLDVSDELAVRVEPAIIRSRAVLPGAGLGITVIF